MKLFRPLLAHKRLTKEISKHEALLKETKEAYNIKLPLQEKTYLFAEENKLNYCIKVLKRLV